MPDGGKEEAGGGGNTQRDFCLFYLDHRDEPCKEWIERKRKIEFKRRK